MFTSHIRACVQAMMFSIFTLSDVSTIPQLSVNLAADQFVDRGRGGHLGLVVPEHVVVENDHVKEHSLGMMIEHSSNLKPKTVIQVIFPAFKRRLKMNLSETCPHWGRWKPWGPCSQPCYTDGQPKPVQDRYRCWTINGVEDCGTGSGHEYYDYAERPCNTNNKCAAVCEWSDWGQWSACNPDCKQGIRLQRRTNNEDSEGTG